VPQRALALPPSLQEGRQRTNEKAGALERQLTEAQQAAAQQLEGLRSELRESQVKGSLVWVVVCCGRP